jgi:hypothetical protein
VRSAFRVCAAIAICTLWSESSAVHAHTLLDPEVAHTMLVEIAEFQKTVRSEANQELRAEALFKMGSRVQALVELLDLDVAAHDGASTLAQLLVKRLDDYEVRIAYSEQRRQFSYDQGAFRQYLKLTPNGLHAAEARFRILAETFYATLGSGPGAVAPEERASVIRAASEEEHFLKDYPDHPRTKEVRFFLGVDCYRLSRSIPDPDKAAQYQRRAKQALQRVVAEYAGSVEARASSALLDEISGAHSRQ